MVIGWTHLRIFLNWASSFLITSTSNRNSFKSWIFHAGKLGFWLQRSSCRRVQLRGLSNNSLALSTHNSDVRLLDASDNHLSQTISETTMINLLVVNSFYHGIYWLSSILTLALRSTSIATKVPILPPFTSLSILSSHANIANSSRTAMKAIRPKAPKGDRCI